MENVADIFELWAKLTGFDAGAAARGADNTNPWELQKTMKELRRAQELDPTDLLVLMMLEEALDRHLADTSVSAYAYLADPTAFDGVLEQGRRMRSLLQGSGMYAARDDLRANVMRALDHYGAGERADVLEMLSKRGSITYLWRDALEAMDRSLSTHQFLRGEAEPQGYKPLYQSSVLGFWSVNDALRLMANMPSGISMCLIRDRDAIHSYFAFVVRNGGNLSLVTDVPNWAHPLQKRMSRRPERSLDERMGRSRFPYELLNIEYHVDEDGEVVGLSVPRQEGLVPHQSRAYKIKPISEIAADEVVWTAIMFALLTKKFFVDDWKAPELSYTGEMVDIPQVLEIAAAHAGLPVAVGDYKPLKTEPLKSVELTAERAVEEGQVKSSEVHDWMEKRYAGQVSDQLLNLNASPHGKVLMLTKSGETRYVSAETASSVSRGFRWGDTSDLHTEIQEFDATAFGSADRLKADRVYLARLNQAKEIGRLASLEFDGRKSEIEAWWQRAVDKNRDRLFQAIRDGRFPVRSDMPADRLGNTNFTHLEPGERELFSRYTIEEANENRSIWAFSCRTLGRLAPGRSSKWRCASSDRPATDVCFFRLQTADDIAAVADLRRSDLPDVLQHWTSDDRSMGNHILDRIDPMDWAIRNPWSRMNFNILIYISRYVFPAPPPLVRTDRFTGKPISPADAQ